MRLYQRIYPYCCSRWVRLALILVTLLAYGAGFDILYRYFRMGSLALLVLPGALAGGFFGFSAGVLASLIALFYNAIVLELHGLAGWSVMRSSVPGGAVIVIVSGITGWLRNLLIKVRAQSEQLQQKQIALEEQIRRREQIELELRESEARFRRLTEKAPDIIYRYRLHPTLHCEYVNPIVTQIVGYTPQEHYENPTLAFEIVHPEDYPKLEQIRNNPHASEDALILRWIRKDGTVIWTDHRIVYIHDDDDTVVAIEGIARDITDLKIAEHTQQRYANRLQILHSLDQAILAAESPQAIAREAVEHTGRLLPGHRLSVIVFDLEDGQGYVLAEHLDGMTSTQCEAPFPLRSNEFETVIEQLQQNEIYVVDASALDASPASLNYMATADTIQAVLHVPLLAQSDLIGTLTLGTEQEKSFTSDEIEIAREIADSLAIGIQQSRLLAAEQRRRRAAAALLEITQVASSSLKQTEVMVRIARRTAQACEAHRCSILLLDETGEYLEPVMSQFADGHKAPELWQQFKTTIADHVDIVPLFKTAIRQQQPALLSDPSRIDLIPRKWTEPFGIQQLLVVPLISQDTVIGIMVLDHVEAKREFTDEQVELARTIGGHVAVSIKNAQLYARTQELAVTDSLTGCHNRRGFFELGQREIERARRYGRPLVAMMLDLDHFKAVNDTHGHFVGDNVLREFACRLKETLRQIDLVGRYGGDEFAVLLPETTLSEAKIVAQRLHTLVKQLSVEADNDIPTTLSIGVAVLSDNQTDLDTLLDRADRALYEAKHGGRNQTCVWRDSVPTHQLRPLEVSQE